MFPFDFSLSRHAEEKKFLSAFLCYAADEGAMQKGISLMPLEISSAIRDNRLRGKVWDFLKDKIQAGQKDAVRFYPLIPVAGSSSSPSHFNGLHLMYSRIASNS